MSSRDYFDHGDDSECRGCGKKRVIGICATCGEKEELRERVAKALGWPMCDVDTMNFRALQALLRADHPELSSECGRAADRWPK